MEADEALDALRFALAPSGGRGRGLDLLRAGMRRPREALAVLGAALAGKRLRARQRLAALVGLDHRLDGVSLCAPEPAAAFAAAGVDRLSPEDGAAGAWPGSAPLVVFAPPGHRPVAGAARVLAAAFAQDAALHALYGDALATLGPGAPPIPILRPAFDADYLRAVDYVGPCLAVRRASLMQVEGSLEPGAEVLDLLLRLDARFGDKAVRHLPRVLSSWDVRQRGNARRASRVRAVARSLGEGSGARLQVSEDGVLTVEQPLPEPWPLVSVIVPTRDRLELLAPCIASLVGATRWPHLEIIVCDNDSRETATHAYFREIEASGTARVLSCPGPFNFAAMNNAAAAGARGTLLAFVNNDVEAFRPDWLERLCREALRPGVGAVGAKLLDGEGRIQHGGVVLGAGGLVTHGHRHFPGGAPGYLGALRATHAVAAVTAACLVVRADRFAQVGGFDADAFAVDFNDVDLCLRLEATGYRTLLVPGAVLHHREAASRRWTEAAQARHGAEVARFRERWGHLLLAGDPHYHPGFDPGLSTHARLRAGWAGTDAARPRPNRLTGRGGDRPPGPSRSPT